MVAERWGWHGESRGPRTGRPLQVDEIDRFAVCSLRGRTRRVHRDAALRLQLQKDYLHIDHRVFRLGRHGVVPRDVRKLRRWAGVMRI